MKGSIDAFTFAKAVASGLKESGLKAELILVPLADGGDGTGPVLADCLGAKLRQSMISGPLGKKITAPYYLSGHLAIIEMADASGMKLLSSAELNPGEASSFGTGELIHAAVKAGATELIIGIGGSATVDGGSGCLEALGYRFKDEDGQRLKACGKNLARIREIAPPPENPLKNCRITVACDVNNPMCGKQGAARTYGPQKGADTRMVHILEEGLENWSKLLNSYSAGSWHDHAFCGAAGGLGAALEVFFHACLVSGSELVIRESNIEKYLASTDILITGEGALDLQTEHLKAPFVLASMAKKAGKTVIAIAGSAAGTNLLFDRIITLENSTRPRDYCITNAEKLVRESACALGYTLD